MKESGAAERIIYKIDISAMSSFWLGFFLRAHHLVQTFYLFSKNDCAVVPWTVDPNPKNETAGKLRTEAGEPPCTAEMPKC